MATLLGDIRYGARMLIKHAGLSAVAVLALAVGIGLTTTMFSIVYAAVLRGLPYEESGRLVAIFRNRPAQNIQFMPVSIHDFVDWREQQKSFEAIARFATSARMPARTCSTSCACARSSGARSGPRKTRRPLRRG